MNQILKSKLIWLGALLVAVSAPAQVTNNFSGSGFTFNGGDPAGQYSDLTVSGVGEPIDRITITLDLVAGYNGALYAYLAGPSSTTAILLNRVGVGSGEDFGYMDGGFSITLDDSAGADNIHGYGAGSYSVNGGGQVMGTWGSDGRDIDPNTSPSSAFDAASTSANLNQFIGESANGTWRLYVADVIGGDDNGMVNSWSLAVVTTPVPEPSVIALGLLGGVATMTLIGRRRTHS